MLNKDQQQALKTILTWYYDNDKTNLNFILDGDAGTGKSFLLDSVITNLKDVKMLFLASTNEALEQFQDKVANSKNYVFRTVHSSLGIVPTNDGALDSFKQLTLPNFWNDYELAIIDEVSMLDDFPVDMLTEIGIKIIWVGDSKQHAPVEKNISTTSKCISPVFLKDWPRSTLTIQERNGGDLTTFCSLAANNVVTGKRYLPNTYDVTKTELANYIDNNLGEIHEGTVKTLAYSNATVTRMNNLIRAKIFGEEKSFNNLYLFSDKIILTSPLNVIDGLEHLSDKELKKIQYSDLTTFYSNTKLTVISCAEVTVKLNNKLILDCYKINVVFSGKEDKEIKTIFSLINPKDKDRIGLYYEHLAWGAKDKREKIKMYQLRRLILFAFADILHYYAATTHRVQGASIDKVIVLYSDILKINNITLQNKALYVACSRAKKDLLMYRGLL